ncbi:MAG TPA: antitoxin [Gammaproteobacteria bacterium]|jgi:antitoxin (DNA-binding transcriptional repressor) of toxin-antitoxin stability system|nr:antitoxin [Gammaproteobacteria bacterium]
MSIHIVTATEASRSFSNILNKVHYQGESYEIRRGKEIIAKIIPVTSTKKPTLKLGALNALLEHLPQLENQDKQRFKKDLEQIRTQMKLEDKSWD